MTFDPTDLRWRRSKRLFFPPCGDSWKVSVAQLHTGEQQSHENSFVLYLKWTLEFNHRSTLRFFNNGNRSVDISIFIQCFFIKQTTNQNCQREWKEMEQMCRRVRWRGESVWLVGSCTKGRECIDSVWRKTRSDESWRMAEECHAVRLMSH